VISLRFRKSEELEIHTGVAMASILLATTINKILDLCRAHPQVRISLNSVVCEMNHRQIEEAEAEQGLGFRV
jgi:hypothetical protein